MFQQTIRNILTLALVSATIAVAQSSAPREAFKIPDVANNDWQLAQRAGPSKGKIVVVTLDQPQRRQACRIQSFTVDQLVCSGGRGGPRTFLPQQILALIRPGNEAFRRPMFVLFNAAMGAEIWGTVVLVATCPACAAVTAFLAFYSFGAAWVALLGDDESDSLLYLAPGQKLTGKLSSIQPYHFRSEPVPHHQ